MTEKLSTRLGRSCRSVPAFLTLLAFLAPLPGRGQEIIINEILTGNTTVAPLIEYPDYFPDYLELYNASTRDIDLGAERWSITDDPKATNKFLFTNSLIFPADSYLLVFCDDQNPTNFPGVLPASNLHTGFSLNSKGGETIAIFKTSGRVLVSSNSFGIQVAGYSVGRFPGANLASPFTLNFPTPCGGTIPCDTNTPYTTFGNQFTLKINEWLQTNYLAEDWLEVFNPDTNIVELGGLVFTDDKIARANPPPGFGVPIRAVPDLSYIGPQSYVRFWCDDLKNRDADHLDFSLSSGSGFTTPPPFLDEIYLVARDRVTIIDHVLCTLFKQRNVSQGRVPDGADPITYFPNPSPEESNFAPIPELNINELLSHSDAPLEDAVEIQNVTNVNVDISYWWFTNDKFKPGKYQIPAGTIIPPGGFYVIYESQWNSPDIPEDRHFTFNSAHGDECYLFKANAAGTILGFRKGVQFGPAANGVSFGRYVTSDGNVEFVATRDLSLGTDVRAGQDTNLISVFRTGHGAANPYPLTGPIVINEVHYHSADPPPAPGMDDIDHEFVELRNITSTNVALYYVPRSQSEVDDAFNTNGWKIKGVIEYEFDAGAFPFLLPDEYALLVKFDPSTNAAFTTAWKSFYFPPVPESAKLFGPYKGKLSNAGGSIELYRPDAPQRPPHPDAGFVPYTLVERVQYTDSAPWPTTSSGGISVDGGGASLQRRFSADFGNDPTNWFGDLPTPGTVNCVIFLSQSKVFFGSAASSSNVVVTGSAGCHWSVTNVPSWITITSDMSFEGNGAISYEVAPYAGTALRMATLIIAGSPYTVVQSPPDMIPPKITVTTPSSGLRTPIPTVTIRGTASDNIGISRVMVQVGSGDFVEASGTQVWTSQVTLAAGTNWIRAKSRDIQGNESAATPPRSVFVSVFGELSLGKTGLGIVTGATNGQFLEIGRSYVLTAKPATGFVFSNWTGTLPANASPRLTLNMQPGEAITANFVPNPFIPAKGAYNGLFYAHTLGGVHHTNSGSFKLTLTDRGTYSSSLRAGGKTYAVSGTFNLDGNATNVLKRPGFAPLEILWHMNLGADTVIGSVTATNWTQAAELEGDLATFNTRTRPAPLAGRYTLIIPGVDDDVTRPRGDGFGTATIDGNGLVKFAGTLGDGTKVSSAVSLSKNGAWPLYAPLYATRGSILSWVGFDTNGLSDDFHGLLSWVRPPIATSKSYPAGFEMDSLLTGSAYRAPVGAANRILQITNGLVTLSGGNLAPAVTNEVRLGLSSIVTNASPDAVTVKFTLASGLFTGTFTRAGAVRKISFSGAVHQKGNHGSGCYLGTNETGRVTFEAAPEAP